MTVRHVYPQVENRAQQLDARLAPLQRQPFPPVTLGPVPIPDGTYHQGDGGSDDAGARRD